MTIPILPKIRLVTMTSGIVLAATVLQTTPSLADCKKSASTVTCMGADTDGYKDATGGLTFIVEAGAEVDGYYGGFPVSSGPAIILNGGNSVITNAGLIDGTTQKNSGIYVENGTIIQNLATGIIKGDGPAIRVYNGKGIITNAGMITGTNEGILIDGSSSNSSIENSNTITGKNAIHLKLVDQTTITNHMGASIEGSDNGIVIESNAGQTNEIFNDGTIKGTSKSIVGGQGLINSRTMGIIEGQIELGEGDDEVTNSGLITGTIDLGNGDNKLTNMGVGTKGIQGNVDVVTNAVE